LIFPSCFGYPHCFFFPFHSIPRSFWFLFLPPFPPLATVHNAKAPFALIFFIGSCIPLNIFSQCFYMHSAFSLFPRPSLFTLSTHYPISIIWSLFLLCLNCFTLCIAFLCLLVFLCLCLSAHHLSLCQMSFLLPDFCPHFCPGKSNSVSARIIRSASMLLSRLLITLRTPSPSIGHGSEFLFSLLHRPPCGFRLCAFKYYVSFHSRPIFSFY